MEFFHTAEHTDVEALMARFVTVTPLWYDLSEHETLESWGARLNG
jgi:broad specificity polyphosphatase/5'/3'-nucleotidase SurE